jgi:hypothetical protein
MLTTIIGFFETQKNRKFPWPLRGKLRSGSGRGDIIDISRKNTSLRALKCIWATALAVAKSGVRDLHLNTHRPLPFGELRLQFAGKNPRATFQWMFKCSQSIVQARSATTLTISTVTFIVAAADIGNVDAQPG